MIIGNFNYSKAQDTYTGEIATLSGATRKLVFKPSEATADKAPHYRIIGSSKAGDIEFGAAWKKRTDEGREYLSVKLDDPALTTPINCALVTSSQEGFLLVWSRDSRKKAD